MSENFVVRSLFREYDVSFVDDVRSFVAESVNSGAVVVIDQRVLDLHEERLSRILTPQRTIALQATEENKTLDGCHALLERLVELALRRDGLIVAIGGGIIQDIAAFSASILYRGVEWAFIPTTLLAMADSSLGSKTSINLGDKKNLVGNFYPPSKILIDTSFLDSLSVADIKSGIGEMLHFYYYADSPLIGQLMSDYDRVIEDRWRLREYVCESLRIKKAVAERDEFDRGERNKFNYGHTFGHALESATQYAVPHGLAVTVGMDLANYLSTHLGRMKSDDFNRMHAVLLRNMPENDLTSIDFDRYFAALSKDKKNLGGDLVCILASKPGCLEKVRLQWSDDLRQTIKRYFRERVWTERAVVTEESR